MASTNIYYNRAADYNPDEQADGDAIEAEFDAVQRGFESVEITIETIESEKANKASPTFTGVPSVPTAAAGTNTTQVANTAFVATAVANLIASSPAALDTLNELAVAIGNDPNFAVTMTNMLAGKVSIRDLQKGIHRFSIDSGVANTYVVNLTPALTTRSEGQVIRFKVTNANTGASTFNDGLGAVPLVGGAHSALQGGELVAGGDACVQWNSTVGAGSYVLLSCSSAPIQIANASKPNHALALGQLLGSVANGNIRIPFNDGGTIRTLIIQWGSVYKVSAGANTFNSSTVTFPVTFPTAGLQSFVSPKGFANSTASQWFKCESESLTTTGLIVVYATQGADTTTAQQINWLAIGY